MCASYTDFYTFWSTVKSTDVDPVFSKLTGMFLGLSKTESMTSWRSKTVSNTFIVCAFAPDEINILCQEVRLVYMNHIYDTGLWTLSKAYISKCRNINDVLERWLIERLRSEKSDFWVSKKHWPQELHVVEFDPNTQICTNFVHNEVNRLFLNVTQNSQDFPEPARGISGLKESLLGIPKLY